MLPRLGPLALSACRQPRGLVCRCDQSPLPDAIKISLELWKKCRESPLPRVGKVLHARSVECRLPLAAHDGVSMDTAKADRYVAEKWDDDIVPQLIEYIRIPNKSPMFDKDWVANGYMEEAVKLMESWAKAQAIPGMQVETVRLEGRTPLIFIEIPATDPATGADTVLLYGHLDKQPEMTGWDSDLGPWTPVLKGDKL